MHIVLFEILACMYWKLGNRVNKQHLALQVYLFGGKTIASPATSNSQSGDIEYVTNTFHSLETDTPNKIPTWLRLADGPAGAAVFDFVMVAVNGMLWIHGGETTGGGIRPTLWSIQPLNGLDLSMSGGFTQLEPVWSVHGQEGIAERKQHCAASVGDVIYFWGGVNGAVSYLLYELILEKFIYSIYICA
jgi:hypothetical protein